MFGTRGTTRKPKDVVNGIHTWNGGRYGRPLLVIIFCSWFVIPRSLLSSALDSEVAVGSYVLVRENFDGCLIIIFSHAFPLTLIPIGIKSFYVVLGMDWLSANRAEILCFAKCKLVEGGSIMARGKKLWGLYR